MRLHPTLEGPLYHGGICVPIASLVIRKSSDIRGGIESDTAADTTVEERRFQRRVRHGKEWGLQPLWIPLPLDLNPQMLLTTLQLPRTWGNENYRKFTAY